MAQRQNAHPHIMKDAPHLGKHGYVPDQKESQYQDSKYTYYNNVEIGRGKDFCQHLGIRARLFKEGIKHPCLHNQGYTRYQCHAKRVNQSFRHHGSQ